jgi:hypothetical protein
MAHSYDNTLLQRMGFSDPDRRTPQHDDACIEIATDPERFVRAVKERIGVQYASCKLEVPLQKGDGKYASTIGFIDAVIEWRNSIDGQRPEPRCRCVTRSQREECVCLVPVSGPLALGWMSSTMLVEVKTKIDSVGNLLRQMNLYREYRPHVDEYVIWSLDPADTRYAGLLFQQGYQLIAGPLPS